CCSAGYHTHWRLHCSSPRRLMANPILLDCCFTSAVQLWFGKVFIQPLQRAIMDSCLKCSVHMKNGQMFLPKLTFSRSLVCSSVQRCHPCWQTSWVGVEWRRCLRAFRSLQSMQVIQ